MSTSTVMSKEYSQRLEEDHEDGTVNQIDEKNELWRRFMPSLKHVCCVLAVLTIGLALWGVAVSVMGASALPGGQLFALGVLCVTAHLAGRLSELLGLPSLLGMLLVGIALRNTGVTLFDADYQSVAAVLRKMSIAVIMSSAGLELDPKSLRRLSFMVIRLSLLPALTEGLVLAGIAYLLLDLPWIWGALLGSVMGAISPAVVIPCMYSLQRRGFSVENGISTLIIAAASLDDIVAVSVFGVLLSVIFSTGDLGWRIAQGPLGLLIGVLFGVLWGFFARFVPHKTDSHVVALRTLLIFAGGLLSVLGSESIGYDAAGTLGCVLSAFIASHGWRQQDLDYGKNPVAEKFATIWDLFEPLLFAFIGVEIDFQDLDGHTVGLGVAVMLVALVARVVMSICVTAGGDFNLKEKLFIALAWFPKATVQAALGPVALDVARRRAPPQDDQMVYAHSVLVIAVLGILFTAPVGAAVISLVGPRLLSHRIIPSTSSLKLSEAEMSRL